jgi:hypothetical protein
VKDTVKETVKDEIPKLNLVDLAITKDVKVGLQPPKKKKVRSI